MGEKNLSQDIGLYLHIPFCRHLCHYCDFAKTANYSEKLENRYWERLAQSLELCLSDAQSRWFPAGLRIRSVFLGGGTPSLYDKEWSTIFSIFRPYLKADAEITLEANPDDMLPSKLECWQELGINRLSLGIQSFQSKGLKFLTRQHSAQEARQAVSQALSYMDNVNIDLIYGWPSQTCELWRDDLAIATELGVKHLSLYNLGYEAGTPMGRRVIRGALEPMPEEEQLALYELARSFLASRGFEHEEVSNWARPGYSCQHNWLYWSDQPYLGLGLGAHGYFHHPDWPWGLRYSFPKRLTSLLNHEIIPSYDDLPAFLHSLGADCEVDRSGESWLLETVGCGLRSRLGIDIRAIERRLGQRFQPRPLIETGLEKGWLSWNPAGRLVLSPQEWFREISWSLELSLSFAPQIDT